MQATKIAAAIAFATLSAGAMADSLTAEGRVHSAPAQMTPSSVSRADVQAQAAQMGRWDNRATEGIGDQTPRVMSQRSRDTVRSEAVEANREAYRATSQENEGIM